VVAVVRPGVWQPPVAPSRLEQEVMKRVRLFVWLREHRHELFDEDLQAELAEMYQDKPVGQPPVPPAQLGLATIRHCCIWRSPPSTSSTRAPECRLRHSRLIALSTSCSSLAGSTSTLLLAGDALRSDATVPP
jgi:hypothetical protein